MTMVPSHEQHQQQETLNIFHHGGGYGSYDYNSFVGSGFLLAKDSDYSMAENESTTNSLTDGAATATAPSINSNGEEDQEQEREQVQVQEVREDQGWLRLSIGGNMDTNTPAANRLIDERKHINSTIDLDRVVDHDPTVVDRRGGLVELDLLPGSSFSSSTPLKPPVFHVPPVAAAGGSSSSFVTSLFFQQQQQQQLQETVNWGFRPIQMQYPPQNIGMAAAVSTSSPNSQSSSSFLPLGSYFARPCHLGIDTGGVAGPSSTSDFRLIDPPRRPFSGIWFTLLASQNQSQEPFLPQISKSYLRIKDGRMTVRLLMKYLVNKLRLDSESEVEITCRGQQLQPFLTLQHVRDNVWSPSPSPISDSSTSSHHHLMVLHYARTPPK
ncbi:RING finger protein [Euphorbia peplus]|nr:RING finger protein [Euphorbia peplus]